MKPWIRSVLTVASTTFPGCEIPTPIIVMNTDDKMLMKAGYSQRRSAR